MRAAGAGAAQLQQREDGLADHDLDRRQHRAGQRAAILAAMRTRCPRSEATRPLVPEFDRS